MELKAQRDPASGLWLARGDLSEPFRFVSNGPPVQQATFQDLIVIPFNRDDTVHPPRPPLLRGTLLIGLQLAFDDTLYDWVWDDIEVTAFSGSTGSVIRRSTLSTVDNLLRIPFTDDDTFDKIVIAARQVINGAPSSASNGIMQNQLTAVATMWA